MRGIAASSESSPPQAIAVPNATNAKVIADKNEIEMNRFM